MTSLQKKLTLLLLCILIFCIMFGLALKFSAKQNENQVKQNNQNPHTTIAEIAGSEKVPITPLTASLNKYSGHNYSLHIPVPWIVTRNTDVSCGGEMDVENLEITIPNSDPSVKNTVSVCTEKQESSAGLPTFINEKHSLQANLDKGLFDNLNEISIGNHQALVYDFMRKDFPGNYEKTIILPTSSLLYRITWTIHAKDNATLNAIKAATQEGYNVLVESLILAN